ncbi:hypothetical protein RJT34_19399 [Clitoria ternatea]|uniref:UspA domain-containing protein n=1 Tax=Clitoria ternatea TaxID=43366 RepID=A0AAN9IRE7_CLITE
MAKNSATEKQPVLLGIDDSEYSTYALEWTLDHLLVPSNNSPNFKLVLVYAKPTVGSTVGFIGPGATDVMPIVEADMKRTAVRVIEQAKELCKKKQVTDIEVEIVEGDARNVLCEAVEKHHASILIVGSHGYGAIKRAVLGSVSDYCAHHAHCTVMIVKKPKPSKHSFQHQGK